MGKKLILLIEDDPSIQMTFAELLGQEGYDVEVANHGRDALKKLQELSANQLPNLILLDLMMPVMDGFGFREAQLKQPQWAHIPVVVMSANGNLREKLEQLGGNLPSIHKPPDLETVLEMINIHCV